jgi:hypothetical protein
MIDEEIREVLKVTVNEIATLAVKVCPEVPDNDYWAGIILDVFKEYIKGNNYIRLSPDQTLPDVSSVTDEQEKLAHCCQWFDRDWYYAGQAEAYLRLTNTRYLGNTCWRRVILEDEISERKEG